MSFTTEPYSKVETEYNELWDFLIDYDIATEAELDLIARINGWQLESLEDVLFVRTGYRDLQQYKECELNEVNDE